MNFLTKENYSSKLWTLLILHILLQKDWPHRSSFVLCKVLFRYKFLTLALLWVVTWRIICQVDQRQVFKGICTGIREENVPSSLRTFNEDSKTVAAQNISSFESKKITNSIKLWTLDLLDEIVSRDSMGP